MCFGGGSNSQGMWLVTVALVGLKALWTMEDGFPAILSYDIHLLAVTYWDSGSGVTGRVSAMV